MGYSHTIQLGEGRSSWLGLVHDVAQALAGVWRPRWSGAALLGDARVMALYGGALEAALRQLVPRVVVAAFPPGEGSKTRRTKEVLEDRLLEAGLDRDACVVGLGGGVSLDLTGFVAATYLRGVDHLLVPTSLLAQVDASVGGKTGVNTPRGKNLVGAFHQPVAVLVDPGCLGTLPPGEWRNGLAELVKHAVVGDGELFEVLEGSRARLALPGSLDEALLWRALSVKLRVVAGDEREQGLRRVLNFGHTLGHAVEGASEGRIPHGQAVALGMLLEAEAARTACGFPAAHGERLLRLLEGLGLPVARPALPFEELIPFLAADKKNRQGRIHASLPLRIGEMAGADSGYRVALEQRRLAAIWEGWPVEEPR